uniref:Reverse transcriptase n=1 Tax=Cucumis melo subsp. melo TaxID=412675 RepID=A6YTD8_CUCME|nr:reverse transcriptase [Cucumis melo subsp. melo]
MMEKLNYDGNSDSTQNSSPSLHLQLPLTHSDIIKDSIGQMLTNENENKDKNKKKKVKVKAYQLNYISIQVIAKVIAERLKETLHTVAENQMAFIKGRQITDAILIANEAIDYWRVKKVKGFLIKLDLEKAFDKIRWSFIDYMLLKKGYPHRLRNWIKAYISSVQYSIIINGRPRGKFQPSRGIHQGDPISPFIFVLAMDYLSRLIETLVDKIKGVSLNDNLNLTHLLFAYDILLFVEDNEDSLKNLRNVIHLFQLALGINVNLNKSTISPVNLGASRTNQVATSWGINTHFLPTNYLGVPLAFPPTSFRFSKLLPPSTKVLNKVGETVFGTVQMKPKNCIWLGGRWFLRQKKKGSWNQPHQRYKFRASKQVVMEIYL